VSFFVKNVNNSAYFAKLRYALMCAKFEGNPITHSHIMAVFASMQKEEKENE